ncbi:hypothetical protein F511_21090, partial [Dorcoceras hygrometricum]
EEENKDLHSEVQRFKEEVKTSWMLEKEKFFKSEEFTILCSEKASVYFEHGLNGCLPQLRDSIGYPRMRASGESSTTKHRLLHASGSHPIPPPNDPK